MFRLGFLDENLGPHLASQAPQLGLPNQKLVS